jgi:hypothetical protein
MPSKLQSPIASWRRAGLCALFFAAFYSLAPAAPARADEEPPQVDLGAPFVLAQGESMRVGPDGLSMTLRTISEESGCMAPDDCAIMVFAGTIYLREGEKRLLMQLDASFQPEKPADFEFEAYKVLVTAVHRVKGKVQVSFRVEQEPEAAEGPPGGR